MLSEAKHLYSYWTLREGRDSSLRSE